MSVNVIARRVLERHGAEDLLEMLGLVAEDGSTPPDDTTGYTFADPARGPGAKNPDVITREPAQTTAPASLRNPPPGANPPELDPPKRRRGPAPKPKPPKKVRPIPECGSYKAYARHRRRGEPIDDACREASREYGRTASSEYRRKEKELKRLIEAGVNPETARVLADGVR